MRLADSGSGLPQQSPLTLNLKVVDLHLNNQLVSLPCRSARSSIGGPCKALLQQRRGLLRAAPLATRHPRLYGFGTEPAKLWQVGHMRRRLSS